MDWPNKQHKINNCTDFFNLFPLPAAPLLPVPWGPFLHFFFNLTFIYGFLHQSLFSFASLRFPPRTAFLRLTIIFSGLSMYTSRNRKVEFTVTVSAGCRSPIYVLKPLRFISTQVCFLFGSHRRMWLFKELQSRLKGETNTKHFCWGPSKYRAEKLKAGSQGDSKNQPNTKANTKNQPKSHECSDWEVWELPACLWLHFQIVHWHSHSIWNGSLFSPASLTFFPSTFHEENTFCDSSSMMQ